MGPIKGPAPVEAQPVDPAAGLQIYRSTEGQAAPAQPNFTPPPETPRARAPVVAVTPPPAPAAAVAPPAPKAAPTAPVSAQSAGPVSALPLAPGAKPAPAVLKPALPTAAPKPDAAVAAGGAMVQIGAFSSQTLADKGWNDAARIAPGPAAGKGKKVEAIQKDGATLYRTAVTGFASRADATAFCEKLKAAGKSCFVK